MYGIKSRGRKMGSAHSKRMFSGVAQHVKAVNIHQVPMRGGFRL